MIGATLAVVSPPFEESLCSMNIMIVNYCATAVKMHIDEKYTFPKIVRSPLAFFTTSSLIFN